MMRRLSCSPLAFLLLVGIGLQLLVYVMAYQQGEPLDWVVVLSGLAGVFSVTLCAAGCISFYFFGFLQIVSYLYITYTERLWGEVGMNVFYFVSQCYGVWVWRRRASVSNQSQVLPRALSSKCFVGLCALTAVVSVVVSLLLKAYTNDAQPWLDAFTTVPSVFAQILMVLAYREQWYVWLFVDIVSVIMWLAVDNPILVALYVYWCFTCLYGLKQWSAMQSSSRADFLVN